MIRIYLGKTYSLNTYSLKPNVYTPNFTLKPHL